MKIMTTIIMRTSDDNRGQLFLALFQGFHFLGNLPISLVFHEVTGRTTRGPYNRPSRQWHPKSIPPPTGLLQTAQNGMAEVARATNAEKRPNNSE